MAKTKIEKKCRCGRLLYGSRKLCIECREKENEYKKALRRTNIKLDELTELA